MDVIHHPTHEHPLRLRELFVDDEPPDLLHCGGCEFPLRGPTYCCDQCKFVFHRSCAEFPIEITHPFHSEHRLAIFFRELDPAWSDGHEVPRQTFAYHCSQGCRFELEGVNAIAILPEGEVGRETIWHMSHEHPLTACSVKRECKLECDGCTRTVLGEAFVCYGCKFVLHKECAELPQSMQHPFHAFPLDLIFDPANASECSACKTHCILFYGCRECQYRLDVSCATSILTVEDSTEEEEESSVVEQSPHVREFTCFRVISLNRIRCAFCSMFLSIGQACGSPGRGFFLHESCAKEPEELSHPLHPEAEHHLTLVEIDKSDRYSLDFCSCCSYGSREYPGYHFKCQQCLFTLDPDCCLESLAFFQGGGNMHIKHPLHDHRLRFGRNPVRLCKICRETTNRPSYFCDTTGCKFCLHASCAELRTEMEHPFHPQHQLARNPKAELSVFTCSACNMNSKTWAFSCVACNFNVDAFCAVRVPDFKHPLHEHKLTYFKETEKLMCNACDNHCNLDLYRCVPCNFNLHRSCLALPQTVKHERHWHSLILYDKYLEDDTGEYYCEICAKNRHPDRGVYCCITCEFFAHIECALKERNLNVTDDVALKEIDDKIASLQAAAETKRKELDDIASKLEALGRKILNS